MPLQALHLLGGWPEGLWYRTDSSGQPHGALVWILLGGAVLHVLQIDYAGSQTATFCRIVLDTLPVSTPQPTLAGKFAVWQQVSVKSTFKHMPINTS